MPKTSIVSKRPKLPRPKDSAQRDRLIRGITDELWVLFKMYCMQHGLTVGKGLTRAIKLMVQRDIKRGADNELNGNLISATSRLADDLRRNRD